MEEAEQLCERLVIIDHGKMLALGSPAELKENLGADTVITVTVAGDAAILAEQAALLPGVRTVERDGRSCACSRPRAEGVLAKLVETASAAGLHVRDAASLPPSLETVFLTLTGREYRE